MSHCGLFSKYYVKFLGALLTLIGEELKNLVFQYSFQKSGFSFSVSNLNLKIGISLLPCKVPTFLLRNIFPLSCLIIFCFSYFHQTQFLLDFLSKPKYDRHNFWATAFKNRILGRQVYSQCIDWLNCLNSREKVYVFAL